MMRIDRLLFGTAAAIGLVASVPAEATHSRRWFAAMRIGGLHLNMTPAAFDAMVRAHSDWNEPQVQGNADCAELGLIPQEEGGPPYFANVLGATDTAGHRYAVTLVLEGSGPVAERVGYAERRAPASWAVRLAEAERRFGKADWTGMSGSWPMARWCTVGDETCLKGAPGAGSAGPSLSLSFFAHPQGELEAGDRLDYELNRGSAVREAFQAGWFSALKAASPAERTAMLARCRGWAGGFPSLQAMYGHYASLNPLGRNASLAVMSADAVPPAAFAALGIDAESTFGKGVCFNSSDVWFERPECPGGQTNIGFHWARHMDDLWLLALFSGGASRGRPYYAVREVAPGRYRKVWWETGPLDGVGRFNAWRAAGAVPMAEVKR
jgi:hypothetical protein